MLFIQALRKVLGLKSAMQLGPMLRNAMLEDDMDRQESKSRRQYLDAPSTNGMVES